MKIKGAIFDLDGTLLDSMHIWDDLGVEYLKSIGITPEEGLKEILWPMTLTEAAQYFQTQYRVKVSIEEIIVSIDRRIEHYYKNELKLKDGVIQYLEKLKAQGVKMCVATVTNRPLAEAALSRNGVLHYIDFIVTSEEVRSGKETPLIYIQCLNQLGTPKEETWIFEDTLHAIRTAKNAGFNVVAIYDKASIAHKKKIKEMANLYWEKF